MTYNSIGYLSFFAIMIYVIGVVGWQFYKNGRFYLENIFQNEPHLVDSINKLLLLGYYLFNTGYVAISIQNWSELQTLDEMIAMIGNKSGIIILLLGLMHYINLIWLAGYHRIKHILNSIINQQK